MDTPVPPGRPGNLTPEQEEKLRQLWVYLLQLCKVEGKAAEDRADAPSSPDKPAESNGAQHKKRPFRFGRKRDDSGLKSNDASSEDKYGQTKHFQEALARLTPEQLRETIWTMVKCDHPDALALRFLRARKWDVDKALVMLVSTMDWRRTEMHVDDDIMRNGEGDMLRNQQEGSGAAKKKGHDFMAQIRMGKSFLHGTDREGRPICVVRARLHRQGDQDEENLERYTVYVIETARMLLQSPVDTAVRYRHPPFLLPFFSAGGGSFSSPSNLAQFLTSSPLLSGRPSSST